MFNYCMLFVPIIILVIRIKCYTYIIDWNYQCQFSNAEGSGNAPEVEAQHQSTDTWDPYKHVWQFATMVLTLYIRATFCLCLFCFLRKSTKAKLPAILSKPHSTACLKELMALLKAHCCACKCVPLGLRKRGLRGYAGSP